QPGVRPERVGMDSCFVRSLGEWDEVHLVVPSGDRATMDEVDRVAIADPTFAVVVRRRPENDIGVDVAERGEERVTLRRGFPEIECPLSPAPPTQPAPARPRAARGPELELDGACTARFRPPLARRHARLDERDADGGALVAPLGEPEGAVFEGRRDEQRDGG